MIKQHHNAQSVFLWSKCVGLSSWLSSSVAVSFFKRDYIQRLFPAERQQDRRLEQTRLVNMQTWRLHHGMQMFWGGSGVGGPCLIVRACVPVSAHDCCQRGEMDKQLTMQSSVIVKNKKKTTKKTGWLPTSEPPLPWSCVLLSPDPKQLDLSMLIL